MPTAPRASTTCIRSVSPRSRTRPTTTARCPDRAIPESNFITPRTPWPATSRHTSACPPPRTTNSCRSFAAQLGGRVATQPKTYQDDIVCYVIDSTITLFNGQTIQVNGTPANGSTPATLPGRAPVLASLEGAAAYDRRCLQWGDPYFCDDLHHVHHRGATR